MSKQWLAGLLRARQVQEDSARQRLAASQRLSIDARKRVLYDGERIDSLIAAGAVDSAHAFTAAAAALQAAAATHAAAMRAEDDAEEKVDVQRVALGHAVQARRTAEELHEQHLAELRLRESSAAMRELDEVAARVHRNRVQA